MKWVPYFAGEAMLEIDLSFCSGFVALGYVNHICKSNSFLKFLLKDSDGFNWPRMYMSVILKAYYRKEKLCQAYWYQKHAETSFMEENLIIWCFAWPHESKI